MKRRQRKENKTRRQQSEKKKTTEEKTETRDGWANGLSVLCFFFFDLFRVFFDLFCPDQANRLETSAEETAEEKTEAWDDTRLCQDSGREPQGERCAEQPIMRFLYLGHGYSMIYGYCMCDQR